MSFRPLLVAAVLAAWPGFVRGAGDVTSWRDRLGLEGHGFLDARGGGRLQEDPAQDPESLGEVRLQLDVSRYGDVATFQGRVDLLGDSVAESHAVDLETGTGWLDLREANAQCSPAAALDVKAGRQILTWGTGDLLFINDLFPKDWVSFFSGRDEEYLKAPSDALFASVFTAWANLDVVYTPLFDADRFIDGGRISFHNPLDPGAPLRVDRRGKWFTHDEVALRLSRTAGAYELAAYGYGGYWKSPGGYRDATGEAYFPRLRVYGAGARGPAGRGLVHVEGGYYESPDDARGDDPLVRNSELRLLAGYDRELARDLTAGLQYYLEHLDDYGAFRRTLPPGSPASDEDRHVVTLRLTRQWLDQTLTLSFFAFYSPSDRDAYLRPAARYDLTDDWRLFAGANVFLGEEQTTFFGQFQDNTNLYGGLRYSF